MPGTATEESNRQLLRAVEGALELPPAARAAWLDTHCPQAIRDRAERLIMAADDHQGRPGARNTILRVRLPTPG